MDKALQINFRNLEPSDAIEASVRKYADKLAQLNGEVSSCRVTIESPHKHHYKGKLYHVIIDVKVPGKELVVSRTPDDEHAHEDVYVAIRDAFNAAHRRIQQYTRKRRGR